MFDVVDTRQEDATLPHQIPSDGQPVFQHREPGRVLVAVAIGETVRSGVVWGIDIHALHLSPIPRAKQVQRLKVLPVHQQAVQLLIQGSGVGERCQQTVCEVRVEVAGVQNKIRVLLQKLDGERLGVARAAIGQVARDLVDGEHVDPFLVLVRVRRDVGVERLRHPIQGHAVMRFEHELLLEPEPLLELFELGEKGDDLVRHVPEGPYAGKRAAQSGRVAKGQIVEIEHFALEVEIELAVQEARQVLVDEVVEGVFRGVAFYVLREHGAGRIGFGRGRCGQQRPPGRAQGVEVMEAFDHRRVDPALLVVAVARKSLLLPVRQRPVLEAHDQLVAFRCHRLRPRQEEAALLAGELLDVVLLVVGGCNLEPDASPLVADGEDVGGVVLRRLDVVLVGVGPVELHFLAVVGDEISRSGTARVSALRHEIAFGVVAGEEAGEVAVDVRLGFRIRPSVGNLPAQVPDSVALLGIGDPQLAERRQRLSQLLVQLGPILGRDALQHALRLRQQVVVEERGDLARLHVHDAVQAEVEVAPVELEHLAQQGSEPVELVFRARGRSRAARSRIGRHAIAHRQCFRQCVR